MTVEEWLRQREGLVARRYELGLAAYERYGGSPVPPLLTRPEWLPARPVPLGDVRLVKADMPPPVVGAGGPVPDGYDRYSAAMELALPGRLRNLPTYRLVAADLHEGRMEFGDGHYFDGLDVGEAAAHEFSIGGSTLRDAVGDPTDLARRPATLAVAALTLRVDGDDVSMLLHRREARKVGHAGGMVMVLPVGVFQPAGPGDQDFDIWRLLIREYSEELLGEPEREGVVDYAAWPFARAMTEARDEGRARPYVLGLGVDPLTFATDLLVAVAFDADLYDELFAGTVAVNDEGEILGPMPLAKADGPMQAAGTALLDLAVRHRADVGGGPPRGRPPPPGPPGGGGGAGGRGGGRAGRRRGAPGTSAATGR